MSGNTSEFYIRFRGVRGSYPVPGSATLRTGGNTPCVEVRAGAHVFLIDAGTGIVGVGEELAREHPEGGHIAVLLSHAHHDHTQGIPFFRPHMDERWTVHYFGPDYGREFGESLGEVVSPPYFPVTLEELGGNFATGMLGTGDCVVFRAPLGAPEVGGCDEVGTADSDLVVRVFHNPRHPRGGVLNFRVEYGGRSFVYATDVEGSIGGDPDLADFSRGAALLIHDAQYTREEYERNPGSVEGFGHSMLGMAVDAAKLAGIDRLALFHHDPHRSDDEVDAIEKQAQAELPQAFAAREGQRVDI